MGIAKENVPKIFDKFYRVPAKAHNVKGYGLGLFYVRSIIEKHNGWYNVKSKFGEGSVFKIALPNE
jgi:signal transduction histidine kinase